MTDAQLLGFEVFFIGLLVIAVLTISWIGWVVLSRLYKGQR